MAAFAPKQCLASRPLNPGTNVLASLWSHGGQGGGWSRSSSNATLVLSAISSSMPLGSFTPASVVSFRTSISKNESESREARRRDPEATIHACARVAGAVRGVVRAYNPTTPPPPHTHTYYLFSTLSISPSRNTYHTHTTHTLSLSHTPIFLHKHTWNTLKNTPNT